jgi:hypothetical protein
MENLDNLIDEISKEETNGVQDNLDVEDYVEIEESRESEPELEEPIESKSEELENVDTINNLESIKEPETEQEDTTMKINELSEKNIVYVEFKNNKIDTCLVSNGNKSITKLNNDQLKLIPNRFYFIPVDTNINSDEFTNIKLYSDISPVLDIKYVKDGVACVVSTANTTIKDGQRLCLVC